MAEMSLTKAREIVANPSEFTKQEVKNAKAKLSDPKSTVQMAKGGDMKKKEVPVITIAVGMGKASMHGSGKANGKEHKYAAGGSVTDKLPNTGLRKLASTPKGKQAVRNMGFDV
jgi:hypothetical protein